MIATLTSTLKHLNTREYYVKICNAITYPISGYTTSCNIPEQRQINIYSNGYTPLGTNTIYGYVDCQVGFFSVLTEILEQFGQIGKVEYICIFVFFHGGSTANKKVSRFFRTGP